MARLLLGSAFPNATLTAATLVNVNLLGAKYDHPPNGPAASPRWIR